MAQPITSLPIGEIMTPCPQSVHSSASLGEATRLMGLHKIRHLPVVEEGELVGVLEERDLSVSSTICDTTGYCPTVGGLKLPRAYVVTPDTEVSEVVGYMAQEKVDCALVADEEGTLVGIFTTTDVCRLVQLLLGRGDIEETGAESEA